MKIIVAVTGASGSIYSRQLVENLLKCEDVTEVALVISRRGSEVMKHEEVEIVMGDSRVRVFDNDDMFSAVASGSAGYDAMVVVPCSMGTLGRVAMGISSDLISRAADVILKERKRLILVTREAPLSPIHLRNMLSITESGGVVMPASPSFYSKPKEIDELCMTVTERVIQLLGIDAPHFQWGVLGGGRE